MTAFLIYSGIASATMLALATLAFMEADSDAASRAFAGILFLSILWPLGIPFAIAVYPGSFIRALRKPNDKTKDPQ